MRQNRHNPRRRLNEGPGAGVTIDTDRMHIGWYDETEGGWQVHGQMTLRSAYDFKVVKEGDVPLGYLYVHIPSYAPEEAKRSAIRFFGSEYMHDAGSVVAENVEFEMEHADVVSFAGEVLSPGYSRPTLPEGKQISWDVTVDCELPFAVSIAYEDNGSPEVHKHDDVLLLDDLEGYIVFHPIVSRAWNDLDEFEEGYADAYEDTYTTY